MRIKQIFIRQILLQIVYFDSNFRLIDHIVPYDLRYKQSTFVFNLVSIIENN